MMPSLIVIPPFQLPDGWNLSRPNNITCNNIYKARLSILILTRLNRRVITTSPNSRHERLSSMWVLLLKSNKE
jgi:hypothetical protein